MMLARDELTEKHTSNSKFYFGPAGASMPPSAADLSDPNSGWEQLNILAVPEPIFGMRSEFGDQKIVYGAQESLAIRFRAKVYPKMFKLFGVYRLPGGKPLIHNGRKPR